MSSNQLFEKDADENNISFEYDRIYNFDFNFNKNIEDRNSFSDKNVNYNEDDDYISEKEKNTVNFLPIISYFLLQGTLTK
ncbi:113_t:CDS:1 [Dentiscutata erythropus]|uniref:113_t:CDS:1 n=1 Tax=Dentiscutata erythropus TaxID=1348616 RepID=A0A9N9FGM0_9GLOM|nr:113_t:CDS:1 [Dentiscutata erythropus]